MQILISYSAWLYVACGLLAGGATALLYYKNKKDEYPKHWTYILSSIRFLLIFFICFLLLSPLVKMNISRVEKPTIILALDHSASMFANIADAKQADSIQRTLKENLEHLREQFSSKYDVRLLSFGEKIEDGFSYEFTHKQTNYASLFEEVQARFSNRAVGAFVLISDGNYNQGQEAISAYRNIGFPLYTVAVGDTRPQIDVGIEAVHHNNFVFIKQSSPIEVDIFADKCEGKKVAVSLYKGKQLLGKTELRINSDDFAKSVEFNLLENESGLQEYRVVCSIIEGEKNIRNNYTDFYIEVLDGRQKILLLANSPHPDISALKQSIEGNALYEIDVHLASESGININNYNLIIFHQIPALDNTMGGILKECQDKQIPAWYIIGLQSNLAVLSTLQAGLSIQVKGNTWNEALPVFRKDFSYFSLSDETQTKIQEFPPLFTPFGNYNTTASAQSLLIQKIGSIESQYPLWIFSMNASQRTSILCGSGIWRWRLQDFAKNKNTEAFDELIGKSIQFLSVQKKHEALQIKNPKLFFETERIVLDAELYNEAFESINTVDVAIDIRDSVGKTYSFMFSPYQNKYRLDIGRLPVGVYSYKASANLGGKLHIAKGQFRVVELALENTQWVANHDLLYNLAHRYNGEMYGLNQLDMLKENLLTDNVLPALIYNEKSYFELLHQKWIFFILLSLLTLEWVVRKWYGAV